MIIAIDFDGTIVEHQFPDIGAPVPNAIRWIKRFQDAGAKIILWTMRSDGWPQPGAHDYLTQAVQYVAGQGITLFGVNENHEQHTWTNSPKAYAHIYIDDAALGCPLLPGSAPGARPMVDWTAVGPRVMELIEAHPRRG